MDAPSISSEDLSREARAFCAWRSPHGAAAGPSKIMLVGVLGLSLLGCGLLGLGLVWLRECGKSARAADAMRVMSRTTGAILDLVHNDLAHGRLSRIQVADQGGLRFPQDDVPYHNLTLRLAPPGPNMPARRILYAFLCLGHEKSDGFDNDHNGIADEGVLLRWDELLGPRIIAKDLMDVRFTRHGTTLEVSLAAATPRSDAPPLIRCNRARFQLVASASP